MMQHIKNNTPAFPFVNESPIKERDFVEYGMSKRFYAACAAMQAILSNPSHDGGYNNLAVAAFRIADQLLEQEDK